MTYKRCYNWSDLDTYILYDGAGGCVSGKQSLCHQSTHISFCLLFTLGLHTYDNIIIMRSSHSMKRKLNKFEERIRYKNGFYNGVTAAVVYLFFGQKSSAINNTLRHNTFNLLCPVTTHRSIWTVLITEIVDIVDYDRVETVRTHFINSLFKSLFFWWIKSVVTGHKKWNTLRPNVLWPAPIESTSSENAMQYRLLLHKLRGFSSIGYDWSSMG